MTPACVVSVVVVVVVVAAAMACQVWNLTKEMLGNTDRPKLRLKAKETEDLLGFMVHLFDTCFILHYQLCLWRGGLQHLEKCNLKVLAPSSFEVRAAFERICCVGRP